MPTRLFNVVSLSTAFLGLWLLFANSISASEMESEQAILEQINRYSTQRDINPSQNLRSTPLGQNVPGAAKFRDVSPGDWAYAALDDLIQRYNCLVGYPDGTFRGNRPLSRYEFAAGLNACLNQIERLIATATADFVTREDLETLRRLLQEFEAELATLGTRVDNLEARTAFLEDHQFSTTTKLAGQVATGLTSLFAGDDFLGNDLDERTLFGARTRLEFLTSFTGEDLLQVRLQAEGLQDFSEVTGTPEGSLGIAGDSDNNVAIDALNYQFTLGENTFVFLAANGATANDFANTVTPLDGDDGATAALTNFGTRNSVYSLADGAGIGIQHTFNDWLEISGGYLASEASTPGAGSGLFNGDYGAFAQLTLTPIENLTVAFAYANSYNIELGTGSNRANLRAFLESQAGINLPIISNTYTALASYQINPNIILGGWVGYTTTRTLAAVNGVDLAGNPVTLQRGDYSSWNWAAMAAFPDLGKEGSLGGLIVGMEPKVTEATSNIRDVIGVDPSTSFHIEGFYEYPINDNISITPAVIWLTAPDHNSSNDDIVIGVLRTTFSF
ncbi:iron uptake porin [Lusitaniella coriacea]|uniref:iron uptake porin n=1 Tax=Lusitaniella coriacea TaxID=1983105 RepID=UPI003CE69DA7